LTDSEAAGKSSIVSGQRAFAAAPAETVEALPAEVGSVIAGRFAIEKVLGRGATGAVFQVKDLHSGTNLALKRLMTSDAREQRHMIPLFEREFHTLAQLAHPCIIAVYDYGVDERGAYYTMELLDGVDLRECGKLPWQHACRLLRDVASSLAILHSRKLLHRDLSPRNVRCTTDGRAKLIDFGVMIPMSVPRTIAGTPPFVPPEAIQQQMLDARTDLYSLGALSYWVLTGRNAYPARTFAALPDAWRTRALAPVELEPGIPPALSELVMELLHFDRTARPSSAAEVTERLCTIAGLPMDERPEVGHAYLAMPVLVAREQAMARVRPALVEASLGRASNSIVEGVPGSGRSRFLDACVLEAKLLGMTVLRVDRSDCGRGSYGAVRALATQLIGALSQQASSLAQPWRNVLAHVIDELADPEQQPAAMQRPPERSLVQGALCEWLLAASRVRPMVLAIDDFEMIDEASAAVLTSLAHKGDRRRPTIVVTVERAAATPALRILREIASAIELGPLTAEHTEALTRSMFGDVSNVVKLAHRVHELCHGNPRDSVEIARNLVDRGIARYQAGSWLLPNVLSANDLPPTLMAARVSRFAMLGQDARDLAGALSLCEPGLLALSDYPGLMSDWSHARIYCALDELVAAGVLLVSGDRYDFTQRDWAELAREVPAPQRKRELHAVLARLNAEVASPYARARHLLEAGEVRNAIELMLGLASDPKVEFSPATLEMLERAMATEEFERMSLLQRTELRVGVVAISSMIGDYPRFSLHAFPLLEQFRRESGLDDWNALPADMPAQERLTAALTRVQQRYESAPEAERGLGPIDAIRLLARSCSTFGGMAANVQESRLVLDLPSLAPFVPLSPALFAIEQLVQTMKFFMTARFDRARDSALLLLDRLAQPDRAGLEETYYNAIRLGMLHMVGVIEVCRGMPAGSTRIAELERVPGLRANAWRIRRVASLMQGDFEAAQRCLRRAEVLELQDGQQHTYPATVARVEVFAHWLADDLIGLKQATDRLVELAAVWPGWRHTVSIARSQYRRLQGDGEGALAELRPALIETSPGGDMDWPWVATAHIAALHTAGRVAEAVEVGLEHYAASLREQLHPSHRNVARPLIDALAAAGRTNEALALAETCLKESEEAGMRGLALGTFYESRARIALAMRDEAAFRTYALRCAQEYQCGNNAGLTAKYERLMQQARRQGIEVGALQSATESAKPTPAFDSVFRTLQSRLSDLSDCTDAEERCRRALTLLLESSGASSGRLYAVRAGRLECIAAMPPGEAAPELAAALEKFLQREIERPQATIAFSGGVSPQITDDSTSQATGDHDRSTIVALTASRDGEQVIVGAVVFGPSPRGLSIALDEMLHAVAQSLLEREDVQPLTCIG
jgi:hypothetical protein